MTMMTSRSISSLLGAVVTMYLTSSLAEAQPAAAGSDATEPSQEMTFGRGARAEPQTSHPSGAPPPTRAGRARTMEDVTEAVTEELTIRNMRWRYSLNFFGDISLGATKPAGTDHPFGFGLGAQDLLIRGELSSQITATTEIALEPGDEGVTVDVERFAVRWQSSGYFIEAGRTHTAFGYWNNAYHHGRWLQPTIARPRWVAFEDDGGMLPVHWVGAGVGARLPVGAATVNLQASFGNGRGVIVDDVRNAHDYQAMKAYHFSAEMVGIGVPELRVGIAGVYDRIPGIPDRPLLPNGESIGEFIGGAHIAYVNVPLIFIGEGYWVAHTAKDVSGSTHQFNTYGGFVLVGYAFGRVTPYFEIERIASKGVDPFFVRTDLNGGVTDSFDSLKGIIGVRVDLTDWTALKAEYRQTREADKNQTIYEGLLNWSWGF
jgi:hypothetical protein